MTQLPHFSASSPVEGTGTETSSPSNEEGYIKMPVPEPALPPCTGVRHTFLNGLADHASALRDDETTTEADDSINQDKELGSTPDPHNNHFNSDQTPQTRSRRRPKMSQEGYRRHPSPFFSGATDFYIGDNTTFNFFEGDVHLTVNSDSTTTGQNGHAYTPNRAPSNGSARHVPRISFSDNWPFGPNNNPFAQPPATSTPKSTTRTQKRRPSSKRLELYVHHVRH